MNQTSSQQHLSTLQTWNTAAIRELCSIHQLKMWGFAPHSTFEPEVLGGLANVSGLQILGFRDSNLSQGDLLNLARLESLQQLDLKACRFDPADLRSLCDEWARGECPLIASLWLEATAIGDEELRSIGQIESLQTLILSHTRVTDAGLEHLRGLKKLKTLWLRNTNVSEDGVLQLAVLPRLTNVVLSSAHKSEQLREGLFRAQVALQKSKKPLNQEQLAASDAPLRAFLGEMEDWERTAYRRASDIEKRHKAERPLPHQMSDAEAQQNTEFWRDINAQKSDIAVRYCSQKLLSRGAGRAGSYGNPPQFQRIGEWMDFETPSKQKTIFYGLVRSTINDKRRYTLVLEDDQWKLDEVQRWSGGWKRDTVYWCVVRAGGLW